MKIVVIQTAFLGDAILTLPMLQVMKKKYPGSTLDVVAIPSTKDIFLFSKVVDNVFVLDKRGEHKTFRGLRRFARELGSRNYDRLVSPHRSLRTSLLVFFSGIRESFGFDISSLSIVYRHIRTYNHEYHEIRRNLLLLPDYDENDDWQILPQMTISDDDKKRVTSIIGQLSDAFVALAPGSVWETKRFPVKYFREIANRLIKQGMSVIVLGGVSDKELGREICFGNEEHCVNVCGELSFMESVALLRQCQVLISNDSAPTHLGMAANIPVFTLYCSTVPDFGFYPITKGSKSFSYNDLKCKPCGIHGYRECPIGTFECADGIDLDEVIGAVVSVVRDI